MAVHPVIMCGGAGSRLWPASRPSRPKQFVSLDGGYSTFQTTIRRMAGQSDWATPIVVCGARYEAIARGQLEDIGVRARLVLECEPRDSGPAMAAAAALVASEDENGVVAIVASDHFIPDDVGFRAAIREAVIAAEAGFIVTLGVRPATASTAYGYIAPSAAPAAGNVLRVERFVEKPDAERAKTFLDQGYLWNSGNFVVGAAAMMRELESHAPDLAATVRQAVDEASITDGLVRLGEAFRSAPKISIDYALMEKTANAAVLPVEFIWSDLGAWDAIHAAGAADAAGNVVSGDVVLVDTANAYVRNAGPSRLAVVGLKDVAVVAEADSLLVCSFDASQSVKAVVEQLKASGAPQIDFSAPPGLAQWRERYATWIRTAALPLWWSLGADHLRGGFHEALDLQARPIDAPRRARVQARQAYVYATAALQGWNGPWRDAAEHGLEFFLHRYSLPNGLYATLVSADGRMIDRTPMLYDQAFALLALSANVRLNPDRSDWADAAYGLLKSLESMRARRGFRENGRWPFQANAHMHLLEASLAWFEFTGDARWAALADEIVDLALEAFIDPESGALREFFDEAWAPSTEPDGRIVEPGHQFEWAWLLARWGRLRGRDEAERAVRRLLDIGAAGVDRARGVAVDELTDGLTVKRATARLWPQTERLRMALSAMTAGGETAAHQAAAVDAASALWRYLDTPIGGLWRDRLTADGQFIDEPAPASSLYHLIGAVLELQATAPA